MKNSTNLPDSYHRHALGQHFLVHSNTAYWIARQAGVTARDLVIEIGPGRGILTNALSETGARIIAIEKDKELCKYLKKHFIKQTHVTILEGDATRFQWETLSDKKHPAILVGNLPYNVSTQILWHLLTQTHIFKKWQFLFQKEVAERICAKVGSSSYGALSVFVQSVTRPTLIRIFPPNFFTPPPKVDSALVSFEMIQMEGMSHMHKRPLVEIVKSAFSHRRKMLRNNLKYLFDGNVTAMERLLKSVGIEGTCRAQDLSVEDYLRLANAMADLKQTIE